MYVSSRERLHFLSRRVQIHDILKDVIGKNYHGPVAGMLAEDGHHKRLGMSASSYGPLHLL
jgi:hypothetical protein